MSNSSLERSIDVPDSVVRRFFSKELILTNFLNRASKQNFIALIEDVCVTYKINDSSSNEMTELAYIVYERLKSSNSLA